MSARGGSVFIAQGDLTRVAAHAIVYSTDRMLSRGGQLTAAFDANIPGFSEGYRALGERVRKLAAKPNAGDAYWLPVRDRESTDARGAGVVAGVVVTIAAATGKPRGERAYSATRGALICARDHLAELGVPRPWLVALPTLLAGDGGARHDRRAVAEPQLEAAEEFVASEPDLDVAFIPYTESNYQVWLDARRRVRERRGYAPPAGDPIPDPRLVGALQRGECVLFAGSGLSTRTGLPSWNELITELADRLGVPESKRRGDLDYLLDLAQWYRNEVPSPTIEELVRARFTAAASGAHPTLAQYLLGGLPARYFVTTNYDDLLEVALRGLRRHPQHVVLDSDVARTGAPDACYVVKFHGCAAQGGPIVLSRDDYDDFFRGRPALALLLEGLLLNQSFFFVGYGLRDPDFRQIFTRISSMLRGTQRPAFATSFDDATPYAARQWASKGLGISSIGGESHSDKCRTLDRYLDRLSEMVSRDPHLFLADDDDRLVAPEIEKLRAQMLGACSDLVAACTRTREHARADVLALVDLLRFYASHGWRGSYPGQLGGLFAALGLHPSLTRVEQRELLVSALRYTESSEQAATLEQRCEELARQIADSSR
ncbi:MAG: SIR2 family protein [Polyangiaceae bacterium]